MNHYKAIVTRPGDLLFFGEREERTQYIRVTDWGLSHAEAKTLNHEDRHRIMLEAVVRYVAGKLGVEALVGREECNPSGVFVKFSDEPAATLDVERATQDVIAMARWNQPDGQG